MNGEESAEMEFEDHQTIFKDSFEYDDTVEEVAEEDYVVDEVVEEDSVEKDEQTLLDEARMRKAIQLVLDRLVLFRVSKCSWQIVTHMKLCLLFLSLLVVAITERSQHILYQQRRPCWFRKTELFWEKDVPITLKILCIRQWRMLA